MRGEDDDDLWNGDEDADDEVETEEERDRKALRHAQLKLECDRLTVAGYNVADMYKIFGALCPLAFVLTWQVAFTLMMVDGTLFVVWVVRAWKLFLAYAEDVTS